MGEKPIPVWLDCDPGHDDVFAILLAAYQPRLQLLGISTVHGNAPLDATTRNALSILTAIGRTDVPVHSGSAKPFCREAVHASTIHGESGLDGTELLPAPTFEANDKTSAVLAMRDALLAQPKGEACLVATGALTNVGLLFAAFPELVEHIKFLSIMGGAIGDFLEEPVRVLRGRRERLGNVTPWAEFNIFCDPEASQAVFSNLELAGKTIMIPLDLTHQVLTTKDVQQELLKSNLPTPSDSVKNLRKLFHDLAVYFAQTYESVFGNSEGPPLHDPIAVAVLLDNLESPDAVFTGSKKGERYHVDVVTAGARDRSIESGQVGRTKATKVPSGQAGVRIPNGISTGWFWNEIYDSLSRAEKALPS